MRTVWWTPHEWPLIHDFAISVQNASLTEVKHVPPDDRRAHAVASEPDCAQDALRLDLDVIVEQHDEVRLLSLQRFSHAAREPSRTAQVRLLDHLQLVAQHRGNRLEPRLGGDLSRALIDDEDPID